MKFNRSIPDLSGISELDEQRSRSPLDEQRSRLPLGEQILLEVPYPEITSICSASRYLLSICSPDLFWKKKLLNEFDTDIIPSSDDPYGLLDMILHIYKYE